jgi:hypothetical protein
VNGGRALGLIVALGACRPVLAPRVAAPSKDPSDDWEAVLRDVVTPDGWVDYAALEARREPLDRYVAWIGRSRRIDRDSARHAFLLNAYDALVMYAVLEDGRPASTEDVEGWLPFPGSGFYVERAFLVDGQPLSLFELLQEQIRNRVLDYRDHAAIHGGRASDPPVRPELYRAQGLGRQLDQQMARWIADDVRGVRVEEGEAVFSPVFDRYAWDFSFQTVGDDLCTTAARYALGGEKEALQALAGQGCPHRFAEPDPTLNDAATHHAEAAALPLDALPEGTGPEPDAVEP